MQFFLLMLTNFFRLQIRIADSILVLKWLCCHERKSVMKQEDQDDAYKVLWAKSKK